MLKNYALNSARMRQLAAVLSLLALLSYAGAASAQQVKRPLTHNDYDSWRTIQAPQLSRDGKFVAYAFLPQDGDGEIVVRNIATGNEWRTPRGYRPPAPPPDDVANLGEFQAGQARLIRPVFTADSRFVIFSIEPTKEELRKAKREKKKPEEMPKNALGIMDLSSGSVTRVDRVKSFQVPEDGTGHIAYLLEAKPGEAKPEEKQPELKVESKAAITEPVTAASPAASPVEKKGKEKKKEYGTDLILRNTVTGTERVFTDVLDYSLSKDAKTLVYTVSAKKEENNGAFALNLGVEAGTPAGLLTGKGKFQKLTWDEEQTELAFLSDRDDAAATQPKFKLYLWNRRDPQAVEIVSPTTSGFRKDLVVSEKAALAFSLDGSRLFFGTAPTPDPEKDPDKEPLDDEKVLVDLWHWKDDFIQPIQRTRAEQDRNRSYLAVYHVKEKKFLQLADETLENITPSNDGRYAIGYDDRAYRRLRDWDTSYTDLYLINTENGVRKPLSQKQSYNLSLGQIRALFRW